MATRLYPMKKGTYSISSGFGPRSGGYHYGLDFAAKDGTPFYAVQAGTVQYIGTASGYGQWIVIDSSDAEGSGCVEYGHMWDAFATGLKVGSKVKAGQLIGYVGSNGQSSGPHLHITVWEYGYGGTRIDPAKWLAGRGYPGENTPPAATPVTTTPKEATVATRPAFRDVNLLGPNRSNRWGARVINFYLHTEEGNSTAEQLVRSGNNSGNFSYHYIGDDNTRVAMVDTDYGSWSVLDANPSSINFCFAGSRASQSRAVWLSKYRNAIRVAAFTAWEDAKKYPYIKLVVNGRPYRLGRTACVSDHNYVTVVLGIGSHTDVGPNFPWDVFESDLKTFVTGKENAVVPPVNKINEIATKSPWLGKRLTAGEGVCKDGVGRYAHFENGSVYWHPRTGARPIPKLLFEVYESLKWEQGPLGYPTAFHSILPIATAPKVGDVQAFEHGVLYRKYGQPGFYVHGVIGARWAREGYEAGPLGWPTSNEYADGSGRRQDFEHGALLWDPSGAVKIERKDG